MATPDVNEDIAELRRQFKELGFYRRPTGRMLATFAAYIAVGVGAMVTFFLIPDLPLRIVALFVSAVSLLASITLAHTASHKAASDSDFVNGLVTYVANPLLHGLSARYWIHSHVQVHHPSPNIVGVDDDCDLRPFFVLNEEHVRQGGTLRRKLLLPLQGLLLPLMLPLNGFNMQKHGWVYLGKLLFRGGAREGSWWLDVSFMLAHLCLFVGIPLLFFPLPLVIAFYAARITLCGILMFFILAPGHFPSDAKVFAESQRDAGDFYLRQCAATTNFRAGRLGELLCNGLQFQVEHHLFPSINHVHYTKVSPHVRAFCARHGLPYQELSWGRAIWDSYVAFVKPKPVYSDIEATRLPIG
jgi:linoleoyl-CoA desaturase